MRVDILTLATASAAALTIGLASPAFASPAFGDYQGLRAQGASSTLQPGETAQALLQRRGGGGGDGDGDSFSASRHRSCGSFSGCRGLLGHRGGIFGGGVFGGAGGWGGGGGGGCCGGDRVSWEESGAAGAPSRPSVPQARPRAAAVPPPAVVQRRRMIVQRRQVVRVPRRAVPTGFGGSQGSNLPLGIAGLSLILGGVGLLPLARRRTRASERA